MKQKHKKPVYVAEPPYVISELPGYLQKRYMNGHGFIEVRPDMTRKHYLYRMQAAFGHSRSYDSYGKTWIDREEDGLFVPLSDYEKRFMRRMAAREGLSEFERAQLLEEAEKEAEQQRSLEQRRKERMNQYIHRYLHGTGLWREAVIAGVGLGWIYLK